MSPTTAPLCATVAAVEHYEGGTVRHGKPGVLVRDVEGGELRVEQVRSIAAELLEAADVLERLRQ